MTIQIPYDCMIPIFSSSNQKKQYHRHARVKPSRSVYQNHPKSHFPVWPASTIDKRRRSCIALQQPAQRSIKPRPSGSVYVRASHAPRNRKIPLYGAAPGEMGWHARAYTHKRAGVALQRRSWFCCGLDDELAVADWRCEFRGVTSGKRNARGPGTFLSSRCTWCTEYSGAFVELELRSSEMYRISLSFS